VARPRGRGTRGPMLIKGSVELGARPVISESSTLPDMIAELRLR
jgi:hypothetical protein